MKPQAPAAYSPEDMARRRKRSVIMAWVLVALLILFFISSLVKFGAFP